MRTGRGDRSHAVGTLVLAFLALSALPAAAARCGDDVDGRDVPCACGDILVSDLTLADDPVAAAACPDDGLVVRAPEDGPSIAIDLRGRTLRGSGRGVGLRVLGGGERGARIFSTGGVATLHGFEDGIVARGTHAVARVQDLVVADSTRDGLRISGQNFEIRRVEVRQARRDGFALGGRAFEIAGTRAIASGRFGYMVMGESGILGGPEAGNVAESSGNSGFNIMGSGHALANCEARGGLKDGLFLQASHLEVRDCQARHNGGDGIVGVGSTWRFAGNVAAGNAGNGITVRGPRLADEGGNRGDDNGDGLERPVVQCAINNQPCTL